MDEARLIEKLRAIEALFAGATTPGEKVAAAQAKDKLRERLEQIEREELVEYRFSLADAWSRKVFLALARRHGLTPYRMKGQRHTTVMAKVSKRFVDETLWPEYQQITETLRTYLAEVTDRVIAEVIHADASEAAEVSEPKQLGLGGLGDLGDPPKSRGSK